jgi:ribosomal protein L15E
MARTTTPALDLDTVLKDAREKITVALDAARAKLAEHEQGVVPLKAEIAKMEQTLARLDGTPAPATRRTRDLSDEEKERRRQRRAERRAARKVQADAPAS